MNNPKKSLGQNFLVDKNICNKILNLCKIKNKEIIEIGPGKGFLTDSLITKNPKKLIIIEKDKKLSDLLEKKYKKNYNIKIINCDALKYNFIKNKNAKIIIANLPYNISIKLIFNWLKMNNRFDELILMVQKEVAIKMDYRNKKRNRLNFFIELTSDYSIMFNVSKNVFFPKPKIESSVVQIKPKKNLNFDFQLLEEFSKKIFNYRRKKIINAFKNKDYIKKILPNSILDKRAEDLTTNELFKIFNKLHFH